MKKIIKAFLFVTSIIGFSSVVYADKECQLSGICTVEPKASYVYFPVSKLTGPAYTCVLASKDSKDLSVDVYGDEETGYIFTKETLSVSKSKKSANVKIKGKFVGTDKGSIKIRRTTMDNADAYIACAYSK